LTASAAVPSASGKVNQSLEIGRPRASACCRSPGRSPRGKPRSPGKTSAFGGGKALTKRRVRAY